MIPISAVVIIRNEGSILREYFEHLRKYVDEFIVVDQCSTDNSVEICKDYGAKVFITKNWGYCEPDKEFALRAIKNNWAITLDPDERFSWEVLDNLQNIVADAEKNECDSIEFKIVQVCDGYKINTFDNTYQIRLAKKGIRCSTRIHSNYVGVRIMRVNLDQFHFKHSTDHLEKETNRIALEIPNDVREKMIDKGIRLKKELASLKENTKIVHNTYKSYVPSFPTQLIIETSINCNANCIMCPNKKIVRTREMSFDKFKILIDQCVGKGVEEIHPFMHGEPFIVKDIFKMMKYINDTLPFTKIVLFSNGGLLDESKAKELLKISNIKSITFSLDSMNEQTYHTIRKLNLKDTLVNIDRFIKLNNESNHKIPVGVSMTISEYNEKETSSFKSFWKDKVDFIDTHRCTGRNKEVELYAPFILKAHLKQIPCSIIFKTMCINTEGNVSMCCEDFTPLCSIGNVFETSIEQVWNCDKFNEIRTKHLTHEKDKLDVCKDCEACM